MEHQARTGINAQPRGETGLCFELGLNWGPHNLTDQAHPPTSRLQAQLSNTELSR